MKQNLINNPAIKHDIVWVDYIRVVACMLVVLAHCCDPFVAGSSVEGFNAGAIWGSFYRPSVPLFIMISGALLLPTSLKIGEFYSKRIKRIVTPFIFWSILSPIMFYFLANYVDTLNPNVLAENHTVNATLKNLWLWIFNFNYSTIPYWYVYMMLGVYLIIPIISSWVREATKKELQLVIKIWIFTTFLPYIEIVLPFLGYPGNYGVFGIFGGCSWNTFTTFHYLSGFIGYALIGHYLRKYPLQWSMNKTIIISILTWTVGYLITFEGFHYVKSNFPDNFNMLEIPWAFTSFNVMIMTVPIFALIQRINPKPRAIITKLSDYSFGIFLFHFIVVHIIFEIVFRHINIAPIIQIPVIFAISFIISAIVIGLLRKIKIFRKLS